MLVCLLLHLCFLVGRLQCRQGHTRTMHLALVHVLVPVLIIHVIEISVLGGMLDIAYLHLDGCLFVLATSGVLLGVDAMTGIGGHQRSLLTLLCWAS